jgi:hypothetical protein
MWSSRSISLMLLYQVSEPSFNFLINSSTFRRVSAIMLKWAQLCLQWGGGGTDFQHMLQLCSYNLKVHNLLCIINMTLNFGFCDFWDTVARLGF